MPSRVVRLDDSGEYIGELPVADSAGVSDAGKVVVLGPDGKLSASLLSRQDATYVHDQSTPSDIWIVMHGLGKYPSVTVVDSSGERWSSEVHYDSPNQLTITFSAAFSGKAFCN
jgi:hypothetical protein